MSQTTKKKHVTKEVMDNYILPQDSQQIVKVLAGRGNNLHEVVNAFGQTFLVSMPTKFRKSVWIKRGDYVMVTPIEEGDKVKAEITNILLKHQIKYIREEGKWPLAFDDKTSVAISGDQSTDELFRNTNRVTVDESSDYSDSSEDQCSDSEHQNE